MPELVHGRDERAGRAGAGDLLDDDHRRDGVGAGTAVRLRDVHGLQVGLDQGVVRLLREPRLLVDLGRVRRDLVVGQLADRLAKRLVLLGQGVGGEVRAHVPDGSQAPAGSGIAASHGCRQAAAARRARVQLHGQPADRQPAAVSRRPGAARPAGGRGRQPGPRAGRIRLAAPGVSARTGRGGADPAGAADRGPGQVQPRRSDALHQGRARAGVFRADRAARGGQVRRRAARGRPVLRHRRQPRRAGSRRCGRRPTGSAS